MGFFVWLYRHDLHTMFGVFVLGVLSWTPGLSLAWVLPALDIVPDLTAHIAIAAVSFVWGFLCFTVSWMAWNMDQRVVENYERRRK